MLPIITLFTFFFRKPLISIKFFLEVQKLKLLAESFNSKEVFLFTLSKFVKPSEMDGLPLTKND